MFLQVLLFLYFRSSLLSDSRAQFPPDLSYSNVASVIHSSLLQLSFFLQRVQSSSCLVCSVDYKHQVLQTQCWFLCHVLTWPSLVKLTTTATPSLLEKSIFFTCMHHILLVFLNINSTPLQALLQTHKPLALWTWPLLSFSYLHTHSPYLTFLYFNIVYMSMTLTLIPSALASLCIPIWCFRRTSWRFHIHVNKLFQT